MSRTAVTLLQLLVLITHVIGGYNKLTRENKVQMIKKQELSNEIEDQDTTCFKLKKELITTAEEEEEVDAFYSSQFNGREVYYRIVNMPLCSELSSEAIRSDIDRAANTWNKETKANVLLKNVDNADSSESNEIGNDTDDPGPEPDIILSFELCHHLASSKYPDSGMEEFGKNCVDTFAHAHFYSSIHFNTRMTWSDKTFTADELKEGDLMRPNLFTIALHEFGHVLGLGHTGDPHTDDVMHYHFAGIRAFKSLSLSGHDKFRLENRYPVLPRCRDYSIHCKETSCNMPSQVDYCQDTCNLCDDCGSNYVDDYLKCDPTICADLENPIRKYCRKTCRDCEVDDVQEPCTGLPTNIANLKTDVTFPVTSGTEVVVSCEGGLEVEGDELITCVSRDLYTWESEQPECGAPEPDDVTLCKDKRAPSKCSRLRNKGRCNKKKIIRACRKTCGHC